jgi:UV DNA damage repair endonuclease
MNIIAILRIVEYVHENEASLFRYESMLFLLIILISDDNEMIPIF